MHTRMLPGDSRHWSSGGRRRKSKIAGEWPNGGRPSGWREQRLERHSKSPKSNPDIPPCRERDSSNPWSPSKESEKKRWSIGGGGVKWMMRLTKSQSRAWRASSTLHCFYRVFVENGRRHLIDAGRVRVSYVRPYNAVPLVLCQTVR